ncbi:aminotransferase class IV [Bacillus cereus group sp. BfR-BA-01310]|uniref:aminotransferase class IV n=1 Tax=Bacillus cereus group sp. BfR-BA-01310 TaxID=2920287 RepID=UPI0024121901|nr:aminotransferase class IV [Bacillus cereus group sp. BfR-BA-01310]
MKAQIPTLSSLRLQITEFERDIPQVKNVGSFGQIYRGRIARMNGFDDVLFLDSLGRISEGSIWNIGFFDGDRIIWPKAEILPGIAMQVIQAGLEKITLRPLHVKFILWIQFFSLMGGHGARRLLHLKQYVHIVLGTFFTIQSYYKKEGDMNA